MNKVRIIGLLILLAGIAMRYVFENENLGFYSGMAIGLGIGLVVIGRIGKWK